MAFYGWAPQPYREPGKFDWLGPATENYFASKQRGQQGLDRRLQQQDLQAMNQPGFQWDAFQPQSPQIGMMKAQQGIRQAFPTPYEQYLTNRAKTPPPYKPSDATKEAEREILTDIDNRIKEGDLQGKQVEGIRILQAMRRYFDLPANANATPEKIVEYYKSLTPKEPPKGPGLARRMGQSISEAIKTKPMPSFPAPQGGRAFGAKKKLDPGTAQSILAEAGGDKEKAREIARSRGYEF